MTEPEKPPGMLSFAIGAYSREGTERLPQVEAELARVRAVFALFGVEDEAWDVPMEGRGHAAVTDRLADWSRRADESDTILYWIGHGELANRRARLLTWDASSSMRPEDFADALSDRTHSSSEPPWTFVVIDACHSRTFIEQTSSVLRAEKGQHSVLLFGVSGSGTTRLGEFGTALEQAVGTDFRGRAVIPLQELAARLRELLHGSDFSEPSGMTAARLVRRDPWLSVRGPLDMMDRLDASLRALTRERIEELTESVRDAQNAQYGDVTWHFTGRRAERSQVVGWLRESHAGMLVVTGEPGAGKSAFLGWLWAQSQPALRAVLDALELVIEEEEEKRPPDDVFTAALTLRNLSTAAAVSAIANACGLGRPWSPRDLRQPARWLVHRVRTSGLRLTLLLDGLDEAQDPLEIADSVLRALAALPGVRLVVGTRPSTEAESRSDDPVPRDSGTGPRRVLDILEALGAAPLPSGGAGAPLDRTRLVTLTAEPDDVVAYVLDRLAAALGEGLPSRAHRQIRNMVEPDGWGFLFARLAVHEILARPRLLDDPGRLKQLLADADPRRLFGTAVDRMSAAEPAYGRMLRALAYAQGGGLPLTGGIWTTVVEALSGEPAPSHAEFERLTRTASPYISLDDDGVTVYRLAHHTFQEYFLAADGEAEVRAGHGRIVRALLGLVRKGSAGPLHPYVFRYLSGHAAVAGVDGWRDLGARTDVLDRLDARSLGADAVRSALGRPDTPVEIAGVIGARHRLVNAHARDRRGIREIAMAQQAGTTEFPAPPSRGSGDASWTVHQAWLRHQSPHTTMDGRGRLGLNALTSYAGRRGTDLLAAGGADGTVRVWSPTGERVDVLPGPRGREVRAVEAFSGPDGRTLLAAGGSGDAIRVWAVRGQGAQVLPSLEHPGGVRSLTVLVADGRVLLASGGDDGVVRLWDPTTASLSGSFSTASEPQGESASRYRRRPGAGRRHWVRAMTTFTEQAAPGSRPLPRLVTAGQDGRIRIWDPLAESAGNAPVSEWDARHGRIGVVRSFTGHGGKPLLASCGEDRTIRIWDPATGTQVRPELTGHTKWVNDLAVFAGPDGGTMLASAGDDGTLCLWNPFTGNRIGEPWTTGHTKGVRALHVFTGPDQRTMLATGGQDGRVKTWDPAARPAFLDDGTLRHGGSVHAVSPYRRQDSRVSFATVSSDRTARLWDPAQPRSIGTLLHPRSVHAVTAVQRGGRAQLLATAGNGGRVWIWDPADSRRIGLPLIARGRVTALASFPGPGKKTVLLAGAYGRHVRLWDPVAHTTFGAEFVAHEKRVAAMTWFPETKSKRVMLATVGDDRTLRVWDAHHRTMAREPVRLPAAALSLCAFQTDGRWLLAVGGKDRAIRIIDPATGVQESVLRGHSKPVTAITWARTGPDGPRLISGSWDRDLRIWDPLGLAASSVVPIGVAVHGLCTADGRVAVACPEGLVVINLPEIRVTG
ncbi:WD40 repeat domain-containing protein [Streptomyces sp. NPDC051921]|uniref:WD40 repeat domain-containing protein n=1 Tax=Streptomyces sp. NPDC051921 TaxID=3155806 RepID=UPI0034484986